MNRRTRTLLAMLFLLLAVGLLAVGAVHEITVYYAIPATVDEAALGDDDAWDLDISTDPILGSEEEVPFEDDAAPDDGADEALASITGDGVSRWEADTSREEHVDSFAMIEHATVGGVARTKGLLHLTGLDACPT